MTLVLASRTIRSVVTDNETQLIKDMNKRKKAQAKQLKKQRRLQALNEGYIGRMNDN